MSRHYALVDEPDVQGQWRELRALLADRAEKMKNSQSVVLNSCAHTPNWLQRRGLGWTRC